MMRSLFPVLILVAAVGCSDGGGEAEGTMEDATDIPCGDPSEDGATPISEEQDRVREVLSGTVSSIALDTSPAIADMTSDDGRMMVLEIADGQTETVMDSWGGVGTGLRLDCEKGDPFTTDDGTTYEYFTDCRLP